MTTDNIKPLQNNKGFLRRAKERKKENSPSFIGICKLQDQEYWISAWVNEKKGKKYFSLSFNEKEDNNVDQDQIDDDIPF